MQVNLYSSHAAKRIEGPLLTLERNVNVGLNEAVEVLDEHGRVRLGRIAALDEESLIVEVFEPTNGLSLADTRVRFLGEPLHFGVGSDVLGRVLDGVGRPLDGGPPVSS